MSRRKELAAIVAMTVLTLASLEAAARAYAWWTRGSATAGLTQRTRYLSYEPFVMFGPGWDDYFSEAIAHTVSERTVRVLLLGGSTAEGFPNEILRVSLERVFPDREVQVVNAANGGYNSRQEAIVATLWGPALRPSLIITLDGANDLLHRLRMERAGTFYLDQAYSLALTRPWLAPFAHLARRSTFVQGSLRLLQRESVGPANEYLDAIPVYTNAVISINTIARGLCALHVPVLQPHRVFKEPLSVEERAFHLYDYREDTARELFSAAAEALGAHARSAAMPFLDARDLFDGRTDRIFTDDVHFASLSAYELLAEAIAATVDDALDIGSPASQGVCSDRD